MKSHELARLLLKLPDLPVSTYANNHSFDSVNQIESWGAENLKIAHEKEKSRLVIGNMPYESEQLNKAVQFRPHKGSLCEAMKHVKTFYCKDDFYQYLEEDLGKWSFPFDKEKLHCEYYCFDNRIGWETYIYTLDGYGVIGFTDGQFNM